MVMVTISVVYSRPVVVVIIGSSVRLSPVVARLSAWLAATVSYSPWLFLRLSVVSFFETSVCELGFHKS